MYVFPGLKCFSGLKCLPTTFSIVFLTAVFSLPLVTLSGCSNSPSTTNGQENNGDLEPDPAAQITIYQNAAIYTLNPQQTWAEAMVVEADKIVFVGSNQGAQAFLNDSSQNIDLAGKMILPGFHDVHIHALESGSENNHFELDSEETNAENFLPIIQQAANDFPNVPWLIGYGHDIYTLLESELSPVELLDTAVNDRPVIIMEQTSHSMWVNSKALELAGIDQTTPNPTGGVIMKDELSGEPNGLLIDNAGNIVMDVAMAPTAQNLQNDYLGLIEYSLPELAKNGITSIADARAYWKRNHHQTWQQIEQNGLLTTRVTLGLWAYPDEDDASQIATLKSLFSRDDARLLKINQIKLYSDGITSNTTAALHTPYLVDWLGLPENKGLNYFSQARIAHYIRELEPLGFDFHIHAIGERGIYEALNAIEESASSNARHRLTHLEIVDPLDMPRFSQLNVIADCQVAGDYTNPEHWDDLVELVGAEKADNQVPIRSLKSAGARLTLSSDWSVSSLNPFVGLQNAITRAPQNISLAEAIKAYTLDAAYALRQEDKVGSLEVGKLADFIVLDRNLFEIPANTINQTKVLQTYLAGQQVFSNAKK